jgi:hypothetical protein
MPINIRKRKQYNKQRYSTAQRVEYNKQGFEFKKCDVNIR